MQRNCESCISHFSLTQYSDAAASILMFDTRRDGYVFNTRTMYFMIEETSPDEFMKSICVDRTMVDLCDRASPLRTSRVAK